MKKFVCLGTPPPCLHPPGRRMHKSHSLFYGPSVGCGHDRTARAATTKRKVFLKNVTTLSHNLCGAIISAIFPSHFQKNQITQLFSLNQYYTNGVIGPAGTGKAAVSWIHDGIHLHFRNIASNNFKWHRHPLILRSVYLEF